MEFLMARVSTNFLEDAVADNALSPLMDPFFGKESCPVGLISSDGRYNFTFAREKSFFSLGSINTDFVIDDQGIAKKHLSLVRDMDGIRLIPLWGHLVFINDQEVKEPQRLRHQDIIRVGQTHMTFYERPLIAEKESPMKPHKPEILLKIFDRLFLGAFFLVLTGFLALFFELV